MTHGGGQPSAAEEPHGGKPAAPALAVVMRYPRLGAPPNIMMKRRVPHAACHPVMLLPRHDSDSPASSAAILPAHSVFKLQRCEISPRQPSRSAWRARIGMYLQKASRAQHARTVIEKRHIMANRGATFRSRPQAPDLMDRWFARAVSALPHGRGDTRVTLRQDACAIRTFFMALIWLQAPAPFIFHVRLATGFELSFTARPSLVGGERTAMRGLSPLHPRRMKPLSALVQIRRICRARISFTAKRAIHTPAPTSMNSFCRAQPSGHARAIPRRSNSSLDMVSPMNSPYG